MTEATFTITDLKQLWSSLRERVNENPFVRLQIAHAYFYDLLHLAPMTADLFVNGSQQDMAAMASIAGLAVDFFDTKPDGIERIQNFWNCVAAVLPEALPAESIHAINCENLNDVHRLLTRVGIFPS